MTGQELLAGLAFALENRQAVDRAALPLSSLVEEIEGWVTSARDQSWVGRSGEGNRSSLGREIAASQSVVGSALRAHVGETLPRYVAAALRVLTSDHRRAEDVEALAHAVRRLTGRLSEPKALAATWDDVESAVHDLDFFAVVESLEQLEAQLDLAGRDGVRVLDEVRRVVGRTPYAFWGVGDPEDNSGGPPDRDAAERLAASMAVDDVLALARKTLVQPGQTGHVVVWSLYDRALTGKAVTELGPITLFMPQWIIAVAFSDKAASTPPYVEEVRQLHHAHRDHEEEESLNFHVLVRIDLGVRSTVGALEVADDMINTLMDALISTGSGGRWGKARWSTMLLDGQEWSSRFGRGSSRLDFDDTFGMGAIAATLEGESAHFAQALTQKPVPSHLREALRLNAEASHADSRAVSLYHEWHNDERTILLLLDSAFEHVVALGRTRSAVLSDRIGRMWAEASRSNQLLWAIDSCLHTRSSVGGRTEESAALNAEIHKTSTYGQRTSMLVAYRALSRLEALVASPLHAMVVHRTLGQLGNLSIHAAESDRLGRNADLIIDRQRRVRNSITHGNPVTRYVLKTVLAFSHFRTGVALRAALDAFADDVPLEDYLVAKEAERAKDAESMESGMSQVDIWEQARAED